MPKPPPPTISRPHKGWVRLTYSDGDTRARVHTEAGGDGHAQWVELPEGHVRAAYLSRPSRARFERCIVCDQEGSCARGIDYMVKHEVWAAAGFKRYQGIACLPCLSERLGRPLTTDDFLPDAKVNRDVLWLLRQQEASHGGR